MVSVTPESVVEPFSVRLGAALAVVMTFAATWSAVRPASGSAVLVALGAAPVALEDPPAPGVLPELEALLHAASARQLAPTATDAIPTRPARPWNIRFSLRVRHIRTNLEEMSEL
jgi:hypothetical protein